MRLPLLCDQVAGLRYIHVLRNGLDMAYSDNLNQLQWWGPSLGIDLPADTHALPVAALRFWAVTTCRAVEVGRQRLGGRFLLLRLEDLCEDPRAGCERLLRFLGEPADGATISRLSEIPVTPSSVGRHRQADLNGFSEDDLDVVRQFGYAVP